MNDVIVIPPASHSRCFPVSAKVVVVSLCLVEAAKLTTFALASPAMLVSDAAGYWLLAEQVARGDVWMAVNPIACRTPGYPWFVGAMQAIFGTRALAACIAIQYLAVWLTTLITGWWTWRLTRGPWLTATALAICVVSSARAGYASMLMTETLFTLLITLTVMAFSSTERNDSLIPIGIAALLWAAAWLIRPAAAALVPAWLVALWLMPIGDQASRRSLAIRKLLVTGTILLLVLGPWMIRNQQLFQRMSLTVFLGRELWVSTFGPGQPAGAALPDTAQSQRLQELVLKSGEFDQWNGNWRVSYRLTDAGLNDAEADELMRQVAVQAIVRDPLRAIARAVWRAIDFWRSVYSRSLAFFDHDPEQTQTGEQQSMWSIPACQKLRDAWLNSALESRLLVVELTSLLALVALAAMFLSPDKWRVGAVMSAAILGVGLLTAAIEYPSYRYRMVLEPALIVATLTGGPVLLTVIRRGTRSLWAESAQA